MSGATSGAIHVAATRASLEILREELIRRKHLAPHWGDYGPILLALVDVVLHSVLNAEYEPKSPQCGPHKCAECGYDDLGTFPLGDDNVRRCEACHKKRTEMWSNMRAGMQSGEVFDVPDEAAAAKPKVEPSPCDCEREAIPCAECQDRKMQEQLRELERSTEIAESPRKEPSPVAANEAISQQLGTAGIWEGCDVEVSPAEIAACMAAECEDEEEPSPVCVECGESCPYPQAAKVESSEDEVQLKVEPAPHPVIGFTVSREPSAPQSRDESKDVWVQGQVMRCFPIPDWERYVPYSQLESALADVSRLKASLDRDRTGLAAALVRINELCAGYRWIPEGEWGSYDFMQQRTKTLRIETGNCLDAICEVAMSALKASGDVATRAIRNEPSDSELLDAILCAAERVGDAAPGPEREVRIADVMIRCAVAIKKRGNR